MTENYPLGIIQENQERGAKKCVWESRRGEGSSVGGWILVNDAFTSYKPHHWLEHPGMESLADEEWHSNSNIER